ncbi:MAG: arnT 5 [Phycisphaerales bacterium]|nr:arnT 5 [Phycisphaerales bacterium]
MACSRYHAGQVNRLTRLHTLLLLVAGVLCLLVFLGRRTLTEHEVFAAEPAREMLAGHGWVLQPFAGEYRTKKPPGQSWLIAASLAVTRSHSEWLARLPSALAGIGLAWTAAWVAARLSTSRQGLIAGLMTLTCVGVQQRANLAEADMALAFCVGVANATLICTLRCRPLEASKRANAVCFWAMTVAGFMLKGPIVFGFTALPAAVCWAVLRFAYKDRLAASAILRAAFWWPAVTLGMLAILAWPAAALYEYPSALAQWKHEIVDRTTGELGHGDERRKDPIIAYLWLLPQSALPWFPFALVGAWLLRRSKPLRRPANLLLACWAGCGLVMVSLIAFKVLHYVLPIVAPVLILAAFGFDQLLTRWLRSRPTSSRNAWTVATIAGWFGLAIGGWMFFNGHILPAKDAGGAVVRFADAVNVAVPPGQTLYLYQLGEERASWYLSPALKQVTDLPGQRPLYLLCKPAEVESLSHATVLLRADPFLQRDPPSEQRLLVRID